MRLLTPLFSVLALLNVAQIIATNEVRQKQPFDIGRPLKLDVAKQHRRQPRPVYTSHPSVSGNILSDTPNLIFLALLPSSSVDCSSTCAKWINYTPPLARTSPTSKLAMTSLVCLRLSTWMYQRMCRTHPQLY